jgi:hypothetical protein
MSDNADCTIPSTQAIPGTQPVLLSKPAKTKLAVVFFDVAKSTMLVTAKHRSDHITTTYVSGNINIIALNRPTSSIVPHSDDSVTIEIGHSGKNDDGAEDEVDLPRLRLVRAISAHDYSSVDEESYKEVSTLSQALPVDMRTCKVASGRNQCQPASNAQPSDTERS